MTKMILVAFMGAVLAAACGSCRGGADAAAKKPAEPAAATYAKIGPQDDLGAKIGQKVVIEGRLAKTPWQHMIRWPEGYGEIAYFDFELGRQTVLYAKAPIECAGFLTVWGEVVEIRGESKRPGSDAPGVEYHILVEKVECAK